MLALEIRMKLFRRSNGYWYIRFERGRERSLRTKDRRLAERLFREIQKEALKGRLILIEKQKSINLKDFFEEYIEWAEKYKSPESIRRDRCAMRNCLQIIGNRQLNQVTVRDIEKFMARLVDLGRAKTGVNVDYRHLKAIFNKAKDWGYIKENPFTKVKPFKEPRRPPKFLSIEEIRKVFRALEDDDEFRDVVFFALETGCRRQEILNLTVRDIDFENGFITIRGKGDRVRLIPMTGRIRALLKRRCRGRVGKVFPAWHKDTISGKWHRLMKKLDMDYRFHDLRHTTASWLALQGVPLQFIQELLGHSSISVTQIYAHLQPGALRDVLEKTFTELENACKIQTDSPGGVKDAG